MWVHQCSIGHIKIDTTDMNRRCAIKQEWIDVWTEVEKRMDRYYKFFQPASLLADDAG